MNRRRGIFGGAGAPTNMDPTGSTTVANSNGINIVAGSQFTTGLGEIRQGQLSLLMLDTLIVLGIVFYLWTHKAQGGG